MNSINRAAVVVRPKAPFFDWARSLEGGLPKATEPWTSVYLVDAGENEEPSRVLRSCFASIFEEQLEAWQLDVDAWPTRDRLPCSATGSTPTLWIWSLTSAKNRLSTMISDRSTWFGGPHASKILTTPTAPFVPWLPELSRPSRY